MRDIATLYAGWLVFVALQRVSELVWSRHNLRLATRCDDGARVARAAGTPRDWYWMIAAHTALIVLPALEFFWLDGGESPPGAARRWLFWSCLALFAGAQAVRYWTLSTLGRAWNARAVVVPALGVVSGGPYRWIRHPNYLAVLIEFNAVPLAVGAWRAWILLALLHSPVLARRIRAEEALLADVPGYTDAMGNKGRFFPSRATRRGDRGAPPA